MPTIAIIRASINDEIERVNKSKSKRGLLKMNKIKETMTRFVEKIRKEKKKNNMNVIKNIQKLVKNIKSANTMDKKTNAIELGKTMGFNIKFENIKMIINKLHDEIKLLNIINIMAINIEHGDLPKSIVQFLEQQDVKQKKREMVLNLKPKPMLIDRKTTIGTLVREEKKNKSIEIKNIEIIEPLPLFMIIGFLKDDNFQKKIKEKLNLDDDLLPTNYTMFENFNEIITKKKTRHLVKRSTDFIIQQSDISKIFKKIEQELQENLHLTEFKNIPKSLLKEYNHKIHEINSIFRIIRDFHTEPNKDYSDVWIGIFVNIFHEFLNKIPQISGKRIFAQYILRALNLLEIRRQIYTQDLEKLIENNGNISTEIAHALAPSNDMGINDEEVVENVNRLNNEGEIDENNPVINSSNNEHYNERFIDDFGSANQFFDNDELEFAFGQ